MNVKFKHWDCIVKKANYVSGGVALRLVDTLDGSLIAHGTSFIDVPMEDDEVAVKSYSENEGMLEALISAGIVSEPIRTVKQGYVEFPICKLLI